MAAGSINDAGGGSDGDLEQLGDAPAVLALLRVPVGQVRDDLLLGSFGATARELLSAGHKVRAMTRRPDGDAGRALAALATAAALALAAATLAAAARLGRLLLAAEGMVVDW